MGWADREDACDTDGLRECIPSCCLWSAAGMTVLPRGHPDAVPLLHTLQQITGGFQTA